MIFFSFTPRLCTFMIFRNRRFLQSCSALNMLKRILSVVFLLFAHTFNSFSQEVLTLEEAIRVGLENNFDIKVASNQVQISTNNVTLGNAGALPSLDLLASKNYAIEDRNIELLDGTSVQREGAKSENFNSSAQLNWTIFNGMEMFITYDKLSEIKRANDVNAKVVIENTLAIISSSFFRIIVEQEKLKVMKNTLGLSQERLNIAKAKYEIGKSSKLEYLAAQVDYNADQSALLLQEEVLFNVKVDLNSIVGRKINSDFVINDEILVNEDLKMHTLLESANMSNPNLLLAQRNKNVAYLEMKELRAQKLPVIDLNVGYNYVTTAQEASQLRTLQSNGLNYGITASFNIFNGFNQNRTIQNAKLLVENYDLNIANLKLQLEGDIYKGFTSYSNSLNLLSLEQKNLELAQENADIALDRYRLGISNALELREAQRNLVEAESRLIDAAYSTKVAEIELQRLSGSGLQDLD